MKGPSKRFGDSVLNQGGLAHTRRAGEEKTETAALRIGDLAADELHDLQLGILLTIDGIIEALLRAPHEVAALVRTIFQANRDVFIDAERNAYHFVQPGAHLKILIAGLIEALQTVVLGQNVGLDLLGEFHGENIQHQVEAVVSSGSVLERYNELFLFFIGESFEVINLAVNGVLFRRGSKKSDKALHGFGLFLHIVLFGSGVFSLAHFHEIGKQFLISLGCFFFFFFLFLLFFFFLFFFLFRLCLFNVLFHILRQCRAL